MTNNIIGQNTGITDREAVVRILRASLRRPPTSFETRLGQAEYTRICTEEFEREAAEFERHYAPELVG